MKEDDGWTKGMVYKQGNEYGAWELLKGVE